ncbi:MAG TPA: hypothetical protein IGS37_01390 [Synechococcales cyanobacterium M55_K2018_004]|nr:hypothetical protein [Synechococcales cyanobacterium M55_K2018_004]
MRLLQSFGQIAATGLLLLMPTLWANPSEASLRCVGLVSEQGRTCIQGFQSTTRGDHFHYITRSASDGRRVSGTFYVTRSTPTTASGIFDDTSLDGAEGCHGWFSIRQVSRNNYSVT